jgi:hypothetical protein
LCSGCFKIHLLIIVCFGSKISILVFVCKKALQSVICHFGCIHRISSVLGTQPGPRCMLGKCCATQLHPGP